MDNKFRKIKAEVREHRRMENTMTSTVPMNISMARLQAVSQATDLINRINALELEQQANLVARKQLEDGINE